MDLIIYLKPPALLRRVIWFTQSFNEISFSGERLWKDSDNQKNRVKRDCLFCFHELSWRFFVLYLLYIYTYIFKKQSCMYINITYIWLCINCLLFLFICLFNSCMFWLLLIDVYQKSLDSMFSYWTMRYIHVFCHIVLGFMEAPKSFWHVPTKNSRRKRGREKWSCQDVRVTVGLGWFLGFIDWSPLFHSRQFCSEYREASKLHQW